VDRADIDGVTKGVSDPADMIAVEQVVRFTLGELAKYRLYTWRVFHSE